MNDPPQIKHRVLDTFDITIAKLHFILNFHNTSFIISVPLARLYSLTNLRVLGVYLASFLLLVII
jgi:hypothetical protein